MPLLAIEDPLLHTHCQKIPLMVETEGHYLLGILRKEQKLHLVRVQVLQSYMLTNRVDQLVLDELFLRVHLLLGDFGVNGIRYLLSFIKL